MAADGTPRPPLGERGVEDHRGMEPGALDTAECRGSGLGAWSHPLIASGSACRCTRCLVLSHWRHGVAAILPTTKPLPVFFQPGSWSRGLQPRVWFRHNGGINSGGFFLLERVWLLPRSAGLNTASPMPIATPVFSPGSIGPGPHCCGASLAYAPTRTVGGCSP